MPEDTKKTKSARKGNGRAAAATRQARAAEDITVGTFAIPPAKRGKYDWAALDAPGKGFLIAGATEKRQFSPPPGVKVRQEVTAEGLVVVRVS